MEHLPRPSIVRRSETVFYVCQKQYDGGPFLTYPIRDGKPHVLPDATSGNLPYRQHEKYFPTPAQEQEAFFQTWLFFGLIDEVLGKLCSGDDFVRANGDGDGNHNIITTSRLLEIIDMWVQKIHSGEVKPSYDHIAECLRLAHTTLLAAGPDFDLNLMFSVSESYTDGEITENSIASTAEVLEHATNKAFHIENMARDNKCPAAWRTLFDETSWAESMREAGWCPSQIYLLFQSSSSVQMLYFLTCLTSADTPGRHQRCNRHICKVYQNDLGEYTTQHLMADCPCGHLPINSSKVYEILKDGQLPLLRVLPTPILAELDVQIVSSRENSRYVALSHVWADGLGNPKANELPRCQLLRLYELARNLDSRTDSRQDQQELLLWCDTLCCPVAPKEAKDKALSFMRRTYEDATHVLVLTTFLGLFDSVGLSAEEICIRVFMSGWMRRLWTLQEAALPAVKNLWFQFRDKAVNLYPLWQDIMYKFRNEIGGKGITCEIIARIRGFIIFFDGAVDVPRELGADLALVDAAVQHRSVSVSTDEPLLIGNLLNLNMDKILKGPEDSRIQRMWSIMPAAHRGLPKNILFRLGPKLQGKGYRWAPSTLLFFERSNRILVTAQDEDDRSLPTPRGLEAKLAGYTLYWPNRARGLPRNPWNIIQDKNSLYMRDDQGVWYLVSRRKSNTSPVDGDFLSRDDLCDTVRSRHDLRIIHLETDFQSRSDGVQQTSLSLLVKHVEEEDGIKYVESYMHLHVRRIEASSQDMFEAAYRCAQQLAASEPACQLELLGDEAVDMADAQYKARFDALQPEIMRIATIEGNEAALVAARQTSGKDNSVLFGAIIAMIFIGHYAIAGKMTREMQRWCVD